MSKAFFSNIRSIGLLIILFLSVMILSTPTLTVALPSDTNAGHSDLTKMSVKTKHDLPESGINGLQGAMDDIKDFDQFLSSANVAEDGIAGMGGALHFFDPATSEGYFFGLFPSAKSTANDWYQYAINDYCNSKQYSNQAAFIKSSWANFGHSFHLVQDMATPPHTNNVSHITGDSFEDYVSENWDVWQQNALIGYDYSQGDIPVPIYGPLPDEGKIQKVDTNGNPVVDANGKPVYYTGVREYLEDSQKKIPYDTSQHKLKNVSEYIDKLAKDSKNAPVDTSMGTSNKPLSWADRRKNAETLLPKAMMYGAGLINTFWQDINTASSGGTTPDVCNKPPDPASPANDHPDDRFDVSDEFYYKENFNMPLDKLADLNMRTAIKKGKTGVYYLKQAIEAYTQGMTATTDAEKQAAQQKLNKIGQKTINSGTKYRNDFKTSPDIALFANGLYKPSISLMLKIGEPVSFQKTDFDPSIAKDHPVMLVPSGGFYGLENSAIVKASLDEYVKNGGTLVVFAQQHGADYGLLPGGIKGYGYQEDQNCQFNSVYIDTYHPMLSVFSTATASIGVDGYFTSYPENSTVLLRRTANGQAAMIMYPYGNGYVIATTLYTDFAFSHSQANQTEINLIQNIISFAKKPDALVEVDFGQIANVNVAMSNFMDVDADSVKFIILDPSRKAISSQQSAVSIPAGQTVIVPVTYTTASTSALGIYHIDCELYDAEGNLIQPQAETDSGRFVVSNPPKTGTPEKQIWFTVSAATQEVFFGEPFTYTFHVFNNSATTRNLKIKAWLPHTGRTHEWNITATANGETTVTGSDLFIDTRWMYETLRAFLYDENGVEIGNYMLSLC